MNAMKTILIGATSALSMQLAHAGTVTGPVLPVLPVQPAYSANLLLTESNNGPTSANITITGGVDSAAAVLFENLPSVTPPQPPTNPAPQAAGSTAAAKPGSTIITNEIRFGASYSCTQTQTIVLGGCIKQPNGLPVCIDPVPAKLSYSCNATVDLANGFIGPQTQTGGGGGGTGCGAACPPVALPQ